jgi:hypothetical protein
MLFLPSKISAIFGTYSHRGCPLDGALYVEWGVENPYLGCNACSLGVRYPSGTPLSRILNDLPDHLDKEGGRSENER